jgi:osmotically-inducible protein OsmY
MRPLLFLPAIVACAAVPACMPVDGDVLRSPLESVEVQAAEFSPLDATRRRGDLDLLRRVEQVLADDPQLGMVARNVVVLADRGEVLLRGTVADRAERGWVERRVLAVPGVRSVVNRLETME